MDLTALALITRDDFTLPMNQANAFLFLIAVIHWLKLLSLIHRMVSLLTPKKMFTYQTSTQVKYDVRDKADTLAHLLGQPSDVKVDRFGNIYVSEFNLDRISVIDKKGVATVFANGITKPFGLASDNEGNVYVASNTTGKIFKCSRSEKKLLAIVPGSVAYITYSDKTGNLYAKCFTGNSIYRIKKSGEISRFAGTGAKGGEDGDLGQCTFDGPNSITLSPEGDLYISEFPANRIRKISKAE